MPELNVRKIRQKLNMSQPKFAAQFGLDLSTLRDWEHGRRFPTGPALVLLAVIAHAPSTVIEVVRLSAPA